MHHRPVTASPRSGDQVPVDAVSGQGKTLKAPASKRTNNESMRKKTNL